MEVTVTINRLSSPGQYLTKMYVLEEQDIEVVNRIGINNRVYTKQLKTYDFEALFGKEHVHEYNFISERYDYLGFVWLKHPLYSLYERMSDVDLLEFELSKFIFTKEEWEQLNHYLRYYIRGINIYTARAFDKLIDEIYRTICKSYYIPEIPVKIEDKSVIYVQRTGEKQRLDMNGDFYNFIKYEKLSRFAFDKQTLEFIKNKCTENPDEFQHNIIDKFEEGKDVVIFNADFIKNVKYW